MTSQAISELAILRHATATVVYRGAKTLRDVPVDFGLFLVRDGSRTPIEILAHIGDLFDWALSMARGIEMWRDTTPRSWDEEVARFYASVAAFETFLAGNPTLACPWEKLFQGPIADALTHVGQIGMLRRVYGTPVRGENYFVADIEAGRVGPDQPLPRREFE
jgi:hypothetical protein